MIVHKFNVQKMMEAMQEVFFDEEMKESPPDPIEYSLMRDAVKPFHEHYFQAVQKESEDKERFRVFHLFSVTLLHFGIVCGMQYMMKQQMGRVEGSETIH